ncbi:unnamed protein product [Brassica napus]|uniref:rRNA adenine N(6)-methyltransferase n=1 Tax=Brassica napus TaxID=3708 RepID=A0A816V126_BRANA|nr:unnamed protein product [Brassica napus]
MSVVVTITSTINSSPVPSWVNNNGDNSPSLRETSASFSRRSSKISLLRKKKKVCCGAKSTDDDYHATIKSLNSRGRFPRKSLGQHYMLNSDINDQLAAAAKVKEGDFVLEIGPGTGSLTNVLLNLGASVLAIDKDPHMVDLVRERFAGSDKFKVLHEDFVKSHIRSHMLSFLETRNLSHPDFALAKVVSNLPFNISTDVVKLLLPMGDIFSHVVLLLQDEAALRLVEPALRTSEYRPINILVNFYSEPEYNFRVPRENFFPQPKVDAAVVTFKLKHPRDYPDVSSTKSFFSLVNSAFNGKRKMLRKSLQHLSSSPEIEKALGVAGLPVTSRPEELTLGDFVKLHNDLKMSSSSLETTRAELGLLVVYLNKAEARDKICRAIQYGSKFVSDGQPGTAQNVDKSTSLARKVFRLFKFVNDLHALISPVPKGTPLPLALLGKSKNALLSTFLFLDQIVWLGRTGIYKNKERAELLGRISLFCWMGSSACTSLVELGELGRLSASIKKLEKEIGNKDKHQNEQYRAKLQRSNERSLALIKAGMDFVVAFGLLQLAPKKVTPRVTGAFGFASSLISCYQRLLPEWKRGKRKPDDEAISIMERFTSTFSSRNVLLRRTLSLRASWPSSIILIRGKHLVSCQKIDIGSASKLHRSGELNLHNPGEIQNRFRGYYSRKLDQQSPSKSTTKVPAKSNTGSLDKK